MKILFTAIIIMTYSCSSEKTRTTDKVNIENKETIVGPAVADLINYEKNGNNSLNTTEGEVIRFKAAMELVDKARISLRSHDTATALKYLVVAKNISPYHGEVKSLYSFATSQYIESTKEMIQKNLPCEVLTQRIRLMHTLTPDSLPEVSETISKCSIQFASAEQRQQSPEELLKLHIPANNKEVSAGFDDDLQDVLKTSYLFPLNEMLKLDILYLSRIKYEVGKFDVDPDVDGSGYVDVIAPLKVTIEKSEEVDDLCLAYEKLLNNVFQNVSFWDVVLDDKKVKYENFVVCAASGFFKMPLQRSGQENGYSTKILVPKVFKEKLRTNSEIRLPITKNNLVAKVSLSYRERPTQIISLRISELGDFTNLFGANLGLRRTYNVPEFPYFIINEAHDAPITSIKFESDGKHALFRETKIRVRIKESLLKQIKGISLGFDFEKIIKDTLQLP